MPTDAELKKWLKQWRAQERSKCDIERVELGRPEPHGKLITRLWRERLGIETEGRHPLALEVERLEGILDAHGIPH